MAHHDTWQCCTLLALAHIAHTCIFKFCIKQASFMLTMIFLQSQRVWLHCSHVAKNQAQILILIGNLELKLLQVIRVCEQVLDADESKGISSKEFRIGLRKLVWQQCRLNCRYNCLECSLKVSIWRQRNVWSDNKTHARTSIHQSMYLMKILLLSPIMECCWIKMGRWLKKKSAC